MTWLLNCYWQILTFKKGPQDLPASTLLVVLLFVGNLLLTVLIELTIKEQVDNRLSSLEIFFLLALITLATYGLLALHGKQQRFRQCYSALMGVDMMVSVAMVFSYWLLADSGYVGEDKTGFSSMNFVYFGSHIFLLIWLFVAVSEILRKTLEVPKLVASIYTLAYFLFPHWVYSLIHV